MVKRHPGLSAADLERARSWSTEIGRDLLPADTVWRQEGEEWRPKGTSTGLSINGRHGAWYSHARAAGGWSPLSLVRFIRGCSKAEALTWISFWLSAHPGTGSILDTGDDVMEIERAEIAKAIIARLTPISDTPGESYLRSRAITGPLPTSVMYLADARLGEGALAGLLFANGRRVGVQLAYLDPAGRKSLVMPTRRRFMEEKAPGAVFKIERKSEAADPLADTLICEGVEDLLSLAEMGRHRRAEACGGVAG